MLEGLRAANIPTWPEPLFGVANLDRPFTGDEIRRASHYSWDLRKFRERVLSWFEPAYQAIAPHPLIERRPGLTLGIVSQITPIKQFPLLFSMLSPIIARHPDINFEVIGAGAYTSIRDLRDSLALLGDRVRFWGFSRTSPPSIASSTCCSPACRKRKRRTQHHRGAGLRRAGAGGGCQSRLPRRWPMA